LHSKKPLIILRCPYQAAIKGPDNWPCQRRSSYRQKFHVPSGSEQSKTAFAIDQIAALQCHNGFGNASASNAKHLRKKFMGDTNTVTVLGPDSSARLNHCNGLLLQFCNVCVTHRSSRTKKIDATF
jgi:hypothetical protein